MTDAASGFFSSTGVSRFAVLLVAVAGILSFFTTANAGILSASRAPMAMSKDGLLPPVLGRISGRGSPVAAILATSAFIIVIIAGLDIEGLAKVASLFLLLVFFLESLGLIIARYSGVANYQPFSRAPVFPVLQILSIIRNAQFMDYDHTINADSLFDDISKLLATKYNLDPTLLKEKFSYA